MRRYDFKFAEWLGELMRKHGMTSSRQVSMRTNISHTTVSALLRGSPPNVETAILLARGFKLDVADVLERGGHAEIAVLWKDGAAPMPDVAEERIRYQTVRPEVLKWLDGIPPKTNDRKAMEQMILTMYEKYNKPEAEDEA